METFCNASKKSWSGIEVPVDCSPESNVAKYAPPLWICTCLVDDTLEAFKAIKPLLGKEEPLLADCVYPLPPIIMCPEGLHWVQDLGHGLIALYVIFYCIFIGVLSLASYRLLRYELRFTPHSSAPRPGSFIGIADDFDSTPPKGLSGETQDKSLLLFSGRKNFWEAC